MMDGMFGGSFMMFFWWIFIIVIVVTLVRWGLGGSFGGDRGKSATEILKERYAKGEISNEEFERKMKDLS